MNYLVKVYQNSEKLSFFGSGKNRPLVLQFLKKNNDPEVIVKTIKANKYISTSDGEVRVTVETITPEQEGGFRMLWVIDYYKTVVQSYGILSQFEDGTFRISNDQGVSDEELDSWQEKNEVISNPDLKTINKSSENQSSKMDQKPNESKQEYQKRLMTVLAENGGPDFRKKAK